MLPEVPTIMLNCCIHLQQMEHLQAFIKECDRKIVLAKKRLAETQDDFGNTPEVLEVFRKWKKSYSILVVCQQTNNAMV